MGTVIKAPIRSILEQARATIKEGGSTTFAMAYAVVSLAEDLHRIAQHICKESNEAQTDLATVADVHRVIDQHGLASDEELAAKLVQRFEIRTSR